MTTKDGKKIGRQNYDWDAIKIDYVTSDLSLKKIAKKYGIRVKTVEDKSRADNWFATKKKYRKEATDKAIAKATAKKADSLAKLMETSDKLLQSITKAVADEQQFNRHIITASAPAENGLGTVITQYETTFEKVDSKAIRDIANSLKTIAELMGYQTPAQVEKQKLDRERFEWEKRQAMEKAGQSVDGTKQTGVVLMPAIIEDGDENNG